MLVVISVDLNYISKVGDELVIYEEKRMGQNPMIPVFQVNINIAAKGMFI